MERKTEPTQSGVTGIPALAGGRLVVLLRRPNGPTAQALRNRLLISLDVSPFENGRPDERRKPGDIKDVAEREIAAVSINQNVGGSEFWNYWDAVGDQRQVNEITLMENLIVSFAANGAGTRNSQTPSRRSLCNTGRAEGEQWTMGRGRQWDSLHPAEGHEVKYCLSGSKLSILGKWRN